MSADNPVPDQGPSLWSAFVAQAARAPDAVAVLDEDGTATYGELVNRAARLAAVLRRQVDNGALVGIALPRGSGVVAAILAVHAIGCAYVPMDPAYPHERLTYLATDSGVKTVVCESGPTPAWLPPAVQSLDIAGAEDDGTDVDLAELPGAAGTDPAYVIYTSGSTGSPKGVVVSHDNVLALMRASLPLIAPVADDTWMMLHSYSFDFAVWEQWGALLSGGRLVIPSAQVAQSPDALLEFVTRHRVSVLTIVPSVFRHFAAVFLRSPRPLSVRIVVLGGERLHRRSVAGFLAAMPLSGPRIVNMYGITETTVISTSKEVTRADLDEEGPTSIGVPLPHLGLALLDENLRPVARGASGEIYLRGAGVALGYLRRPALTAERFLELSLPGVPPGRYYRTGDLAFRDERGELRYLGRSDAQLKVRGFRIEPEEIESRLRTHPGVSETLVTVETGPTGEEMLVAHVVRAPDVAEAGLSRELRRHMTAVCPAHLVPNRYVVVDALPLSPSGKLDRSALRSSVPARPE